jgi:hypothetical protein
VTLPVSSQNLKKPGTFHTWAWEPTTAKRSGYLVRGSPGGNARLHEDGEMSPASAVAVIGIAQLSHVLTKAPGVCLSPVAAQSSNSHQPLQLSPQGTGFPSGLPNTIRSEKVIKDFKPQLLGWLLLAARSDGLPTPGCRDVARQCCSQMHRVGGKHRWLAGLGGSRDPAPWRQAALAGLSPFLFLIGTLMRAEGADPLPGGQFMPRLSHSPSQTKTTLQAQRPGARGPGAPALVMD